MGYSLLKSPGVSRNYALLPFTFVPWPAWNDCCLSKFELSSHSTCSREPSSITSTYRKISYRNLPGVYQLLVMAPGETWALESQY